ncbi:TPA: type-F conjugative transfer system protein TrbI [Legionella pneumophila]|nr:type-F conjugative transfer system protein TrbI [Legionella pneumophila]
MRLTPLVLSCALAAISAFFVLYGVSSQKTIVTFDKEGVQGQFIRQLAEIKATEHQVEQSTRRFSKLLNKALTDIAQQKRVVILNKMDVLAGGMDITDEVRIKLSTAMRSKA